MDVDEKYDEDDEDAPVRSKRKTRVGKNVKSTCVSYSFPSALPTSFSLRPSDL